MQAFPSTSGGGNFTSALNVPNISKLPAQSSSKDMLKAEDHVARERRRRDIMNTRFQVLDSLLPKPIFRRDRYGIVEDTVLYVKETEQLVANLNAKAASLKERLEQQEALRQQLQLVQRQPVPALELCATVASDCLPIELVHLDGFPRARWFGNIAQDPDTMPPDSKVEVIATHNQPHIAIVIECRLEFGGRLFGSVLRSIERLDLEVRQCSITNCSNLYLCNASCKPWHGQLQLSYEQILQQLVTYLRSYLKRI